MPALNNAVFWYKDEATYLRFREIIEDKAQISCPYAEWVALAQKQIDALAQKRIILVKVDADPDEFVQWCKVNSRPPNQAARQLFATIKLDGKFGRG
ncbi:MAG TPA: hypothetical protein VGN23_10495 [Verrucomicrobiae bacterium]|jgi:hypothetical protein